MAKDLISKSTRLEFREALVEFTLREIDLVFAIGEFSPTLEFDPDIGGQRRTLVEQYYHGMDFSDVGTVRRLIEVYEEIIEQIRGWQASNVAEQQTEKLIRRMLRDGFEFDGVRFDGAHLSSAGVALTALAMLKADAIDEQFQKARQKVGNGDFSGAIANAYTLVENVLNRLLNETNTSFNENEGDIRKLYKALEGPLNLNPKGENLESHLKGILQGLKSQISGLFEIANKASDRHARRYNPAQHHAKLAVNSAIVVCEFLTDSLTYQRKRKATSK